MEEQRSRARMGTADAHGSEDRHGRVIAFATAAAADPLRRLRDAARDHRRRRGRAPRTDGRWSSSRRARSTPRAAARSPTRASLRWQGGEAAVADVYRIGEDQALELRVRPPALEPGMRSRRVVEHRGPPRDDAKPHRDPPAARGAARAPRRPRAPGRVGGAAQTSCASTSPTATRSRPTSSSRSRTGSTSGSRRAARFAG